MSGRWRYGGDPARPPSHWVAGSLPWPSYGAVAGNLAPAPPAEKDNLAPASIRTAAINRMAHQNLVADAVRHQNASAQLGYPAWLNAADVTVPARGRRRAFTVRQVLAAARAAGVRPHGGEVEDDEAFAAALWNAGVALRRNAGKTASGATKNYAAANGVPDPEKEVLGLGGTEEESVRPDARLGLAEGEYTRTLSIFGTLPRDMQTEVRGHFGPAFTMLADLYALGCGRARRVLQSDIYWGDLFPLSDHSEATDHNFYDDGEKILPPGDILAAIKAGDFQCLVASSWLILASWLLAQIAGFDSALKIDLTPFSRGGGNSLNYNWGAGAAAPALSDDPDFHDGFTARQIQDGAPSWKTGVLIPSSQGWDEFYWQAAEAVDPDIAAYQKYAVHLFPTETAEDMATYGLGPAPEESAEAARVAMDDYQRECARRKSLGIAAFAQGIGNWLATLDDAFANAADASIYDVVDIIELGNELDVFYTYNRPDRPEDAQPSTDVKIWGAMEGTRYMALIAGPIRAKLPAMQFRVAEIAAWHGKDHQDDFSGKVDWLWEAITHMPYEVTRWQLIYFFTFWDDYVDVPWVDDWNRSATGAGFEWPPSDTALTFAASDLMHFAGFHWYHGFDRGKLDEPDYSAYADAVRQQADIDMFRASISVPFGLKLSVGENGFPAVDPFHTISPPTSALGDRVYDRTNTKFQAGMLLRILATHLACGVDRCSWFTFAFGPTKTDWSYWVAVSTSGLHNDVYRQGDAYAQGVDCWQRPAWFTLRRLTWLLQAGGGAKLSMALNSLGVTVIEFAFPSGLASSPNGTRYLKTWSRGYLCWLDQYASSTDVHPDAAEVGPNYAWLTFSDPDGDGFMYLPVVPEVASSGLTLDANGYPRATLADGTLSWTWKGAHDAVIDRSSTATTFSLELQKADPDAAPIPIFLLTNASFLGCAYRNSP